MSEVGTLAVRYDPPKRGFLQETHGVTSEMAAFFIVTAVATPNVTRNRAFSCKVDCDELVSGCGGVFALVILQTAVPLLDRFYSES
jgi:hypothetical protein